MADSLTDLLQAVDAYMATNAKNKTMGPYLATKVAAIFDDPNSIFNSKGLINTISTKLTKTFSDLDAEIGIFRKNLSSINKIDMATGFKASINSLKSFSTSLGKFNTKLYDASKLLPTSTTSGLDTVLQTFTRRMANLNTLNLYGTLDNMIKKIDIFSKTLEDAGIDIGKGVMMPAPPKGGYVLPANLGPTPKERTLKSNDVINANIVSVNDNVVSRLGKNKSGLFAGLFGGIGGFLGGLLGSKNSYNSQSNSGAKGFLGKIWDWVKSIFFNGLLIFGGLFLLGKIKKFLDETPLGQKIKSDFKKFGSMLIDSVTKYLKSGDLEKTIVTGIKFIMNILRKIISVAVNFFEENKGALKGMVDSVWNTIRDEIINPLMETFINPFFEGIKSKIEKIDWSNLMGDLWKKIKENVIDPIWNSIAKDFKNGDKEEGWAKILGLGALAAVIIGPTGLVFLLSSLISVVGSTVGLFGGLIRLIGGPGVGLIAALTAFMYLLNEGKANQQKIKDNLPILQQQLKSVEETVKEKEALKKDNVVKTKKAEQLPDSTFRMLKLQELENERKINEIELKKEKLLAQAKKSGIESRTVLADTPWYKVFTGKGMFDFVTNKYKVDKAAQDELKASKMFNSELLRLTKEQTEIMADQKLLQEEQQKQNKLFVPPAPIPLHDGVVMVKPNREDQGVVFGKENGFFSKANKESLQKLDNMAQVFAEGITMLAQASVQGSNQIVGAISSSNNKGTPATTGGGRDNVGEYRNRMAAKGV